MPENQSDVIIIGAGHNGLVAANYLARDGLSVLVLERRDIIGGGATTEEIAPGFMTSNCSMTSWGLQSKIIEDLALRDYGFELMDTALPRKAWMGVGAEGHIRVQPFPDGTYLGGPEVRNDTDSIAQIRQFSKRDAEAYSEWASFCREAAAAIFRPYVLTEPPTLAEVMKSVSGTPQEEVLEKLLAWSAMDLLDDHFEDERVKAHVIEPGTHESNPSAPGSMLSSAIFGSVGWGTRVEDVGIPRMGMGAVTEAMSRSAKSFGVEVRTEAPVREVIVEDGEAKGVRLADGEEVRGRIVVSNADPKRTFTTLFREGDLDKETLRRVKQWKTECGCLKFMAAMRELPDLSRYLGAGYDQDNVVGMKLQPSMTYYQQSWDDAASGVPTRYPALSVQLPSVVDPGLVSGSGHLLGAFIVFATPHLAEGSWDDARESVGERIIDVITEYAPNFRDSLVEWTLKTPIDIEERVGMTDGNIRHLDLIPSQLLSQRQSYRTSVKQFYMCGAGTHPAGEVIGAPGHNAAQAILKDLQQGKV